MKRIYLLVIFILITACGNDVPKEFLGSWQLKELVELGKLTGDDSLITCFEINKKNIVSPNNDEESYKYDKNTNELIFSRGKIYIKENTLYLSDKGMTLTMLPCN